MFDELPKPEPTTFGDLPNGVKIASGLLVVVVFLMIYRSTPSSVPWSVTGGKFVVRGMLGTDEFPISELQLDQARVLQLSPDSAWRPSRRLFGIGGMGYSAGRFRLKNGADVDLYMTNETQAVLIPRQDRVPLMVGTPDPAAFLQILRNSRN